jgi:hypothetical protein
MKHLFTLGASIFAIMILASCGKNAVDTPSTVTAAKNGLTLKITLNKNQIAADGSDEAVFTVTDQNNVNVTALSTIYVNNNALQKNVFTTSTPGSYQVKAVEGNQFSTVVNLVAANDTSIVFTQKVLAEFYTGSWCGICPGTLLPFDAYINANPNTVMIGIHGPIGSSDPYIYTYDTQLRNAFGVIVVPSVIVNRNGLWNDNYATFDQLSQQKAIIGIGLETSISGTSISVKTKVKFGSTINVPLKVVVALVEDSLLHDQVNYGYFNLPNPIVNYPHRNVLRSSATDIFGDAIPIAAQVKNNVWESDYTINASGYVVTKCRIVAFVLYGVNSQNLKGVLNTQIANAGQNANF